MLLIAIVINTRKSIRSGIGRPLALRLLRRADSATDGSASSARHAHPAIHVGPARRWRGRGRRSLLHASGSSARGASKDLKDHASRTRAGGRRRRLLLLHDDRRWYAPKLNLEPTTHALVRFDCRVALAVGASLRLAIATDLRAASSVDLLSRRGPSCLSNSGAASDQQKCRDPPHAIFLRLPRLLGTPFFCRRRSSAVARSSSSAARRFMCSVMISSSQ